MNYNIKISNIAKTHVKEAVAYYKNVASIKIAQNFLTDYHNSLDKIKLNPYFQNYYKDFRGLPLKKHPYIIFYQIDSGTKTIFIKAVFNARQDVQKRP